MFYKKIASHEASKKEANHVLLLYSGGLDTSIMLKWIQDKYEAEVSTLTVDIGQEGDFEKIKEKAVKLGVKEAVIIDAKEEFAKKYVSKAVKANAAYEGDYHLFCPLGRALISKIAVETARKKGITVIAHGCTGKGNDQVRFESYITTLDPSIKIIAPVREAGMGRNEELAYAEKFNIPVTNTSEKPYSYDSNIWGCSAEGGEIEEIEETPPFEKILKICNTPEKAPDAAQKLSINFEKGIPVKIDGVSFTTDKLISSIGELGAYHGIGITPMVEDRLTGIKIRGIYEQPAAAILTKAHKSLEKLVSTREENNFKENVDKKWSELCYNSKWHDPLMKDLNAFIDQMNEKVSGKVTLEIYKGNITILGLESPYSLIDKNAATFMKNDSFNQNASAGFIEIHNMPQKNAAKIEQEAKNKLLAPDLRF